MLTTVWPIFLGTLKDGLREAVVACDVPEPCEFLYLDWHHKEADLVPQPVAGLVLRVGEAEKFPQALAFQSLDLFVRVSQRGTPMFHNHTGGWR